MDVIGESGNDAGGAGRRRILAAARSLFTTYGYAAVSMQQIAAAVGINKATLYHHFRDKEDLFVSVMVEEFTRASTELSEAIAKGETLRDQLRRAANQIFASYQTDFGRLSADLRTHVSEPRRTELIGCSGPPWHQIRLVIERAIAAGEVRDLDADLIARLFFAMVGSQVWWSRSNSPQPPPDDRLAGTLADILLDGIALRRDASSATPVTEDREPLLAQA